MRKYSTSNPKKHIKWQLNSSVELNKLKRSLFEKREDTKEAYNKHESAPANMARLGLVYKIDDKERSLKNFKTEQLKNEKLNIAEKPKAFALAVPEALGKRTEPVMMKEWDYDYYGPLVTAYGTNYKAMSRDLRRNYRQKSEGELKRMCEKFVEFKKFGEEKLEEYEKIIKEQEAKEKQGTILGAPESIVNSTAPPKANTDNTKTKRKRADDAADGKGEDKKEETKKDDTKEETTKQTKTSETTNKQTPAKKAKSEAQLTTPATKQTPNKQTTKETKPATKEVKPATKETKPATKENKKEVKPATKATTPAPKQTKKDETKAKKPVVEDSDDDEGMEFDFDENDLSSDDE